MALHCQVSLFSICVSIFHVHFSISISIFHFPLPAFQLPVSNKYLWRGRQPCALAIFGIFSDRRQCRECFSRSRSHSRSHSSFRFWLPDMGMLSTAGYVGGSAGAVSTVAAIALILCSRAYKDFFYRLYLDIAFSALVFSVTLVGYYMQPAMAVDHNTQCNSASQPEPFVAVLFLALNTFSVSMVALVSSWLSLHVILMVMWRVATLKKRPFECGMLLTVLTL